MKLYGLRVFVDDLDAAREFYATTLGLPVLWDLEPMGAVGFDLGATLIVERADPADAEQVALIGRFVGVSIEVADLEQTYRSLTAAGVVFEGPPEAQAWGGTLAHFRDPAGNVLTLLGGTG